MESNRVPKVGETWRYGVCNVLVMSEMDADGCFLGKPSSGAQCKWGYRSIAAYWTYVSGPSDAPAPKADACAWPGCGLPQSFAGHNGCGKQLHMCDTVACHYFTGAPVSRITQAAVADELEKRAKDIPLPGFSVGDTSSPASADDGSHPEAARGGEAAVSRADTMWRQTSGDVAGGQKNIDLASPDGHCNLGVACNVCVPPVKRVPWVDSLPVDWWLPDAV